MKNRVLAQASGHVREDTHTEQSDSQRNLHKALVESGGVWWNPLETAFIHDKYYLLHSHSHRPSHFRDLLRSEKVHGYYMALI